MFSRIFLKNLFILSTLILCGISTLDAYGSDNEMETGSSSSSPVVSRKRESPTPLADMEFSREEKRFPSSLGLNNVIPLVGSFLSFQALGRVACTAHSCRFALLSQNPNPWAGKVMKFGFDAEGDRGLMACVKFGYALRNLPVELNLHPLVVDLDKIPANVERFYNWLRDSQPSHLIFNFCGWGSHRPGLNAPFNFGAQVDERDTSLSLALDCLRKGYDSRQKQLPVVTALRVANYLEDQPNDQTRVFKTFLAKFACNVTDLTLDNCGRTCGNLELRFLQHIRNLVIVRHDPAMRDIFDNVNFPIRLLNMPKPEFSLKSVMLRDLVIEHGLGQDYERFRFPKCVESLELVNVKVCYAMSNCKNLYSQFETDLSGLATENLKRLVIKGRLFFVEKGRLEAHRSDADLMELQEYLNHASLNFLNKTFAHVPELVLDLSPAAPLPSVIEILEPMAESDDMEQYSAEAYSAESSEEER